MADYHLGRDGEELGVFPEHEIREGLLTGRFLPTDLAWMAGMPEWRPLVELPAFSPPAPEMVPPSMESSAKSSAGDVGGPPFENRDQIGFFAGLLTTISMVLTQPRATFETMRRAGGFGTPLLFTLIVGWPMVIVSTVFFSDGTLRMVAQYDFGGNSFDAALGGPGFFEMVFLMGYPLLVVFGQFFGAGITHLCLVAVGGANHSFETTFRVSCYTSGSAAVFQLLPIVGPFLFRFWGFVVQVIGLAAAHETGILRVVLALFLPILVMGTIAMGVVFALSGTLFS